MQDYKIIEIIQFKKPLHVWNVWKLINAKKTKKCFNIFMFEMYENWIVRY